MKFVSCVKWVRKGVAKSNPEKIKLTPAELQNLVDHTNDETDEEYETDEEEEMQAVDEDDKYNFNHYDEEEGTTSSHYLKIQNIVSTDENEPSLNDEPDSDDEDDIIYPTDNLIAVGRFDGDVSLLEVYIYNEQENYMYVHHDILLPTAPLCLEWLSYDSSEPSPGNLLAVGGMSAVIGIWDLDLMQCVEPAYQLGRFSLKKKRNKSHGHKDAVLDLAWNTNYQHILASGSVDKTVLLWDLDTGKASTTISEFTDKVQCLKWRPTDYHSLIVGSADKSVKIFDCRSDDITNRWEFSEEIEKVVWCPWESNQVIIGTNGGNVHSFDVRSKKQHLWEIKAHEKEITGLELDANCPGMLVTCATDDLVKIWDIKTNQPVSVFSKSFRMDEVQCLDLNPDCPFIASLGGTKKGKTFAVVNLQNEMSKVNAVEVANDWAGPSNSIVLLDGPKNAFGSMSTKNKPFKREKKLGLKSSVKNRPFKSEKKLGHKYKK